MLSQRTRMKPKRFEEEQAEKDRIEAEKRAQKRKERQKILSAMSKKSLAKSKKKSSSPKTTNNSQPKAKLPSFDFEHMIALSRSFPDTWWNNNLNNDNNKTYQIPLGQINQNHPVEMLLSI